MTGSDSGAGTRDTDGTGDRRDEVPDTEIKVPRARTEIQLVPTLQVIDGPRVGRLHRFDPEAENSITIGRTKDAQFVLEHSTLSRIHARFTWMRAGAEFHLLLEDLESTNGTLVNGERTDTKFLKDGDRISLGDAVLRFQMLSVSELEERDRLLARAQGAEVDPLTGLGTRLHMEELVPRIFADCEARKVPVSVLLLDLDHFKKVNDTLGHAVGDKVLRAVGGVIQSQLLARSASIRLGGEEILVILPGAALESAQLVAERLRCAINRYDARPISPDLRITVSIGVAERRTGERFADLLIRADASLYRAKELGRDRVEISPASAPGA